MLKVFTRKNFIKNRLYIGVVLASLLFGSNGNGNQVDHTYTTNNRFTVTLSGNGTSCATRIITVNPWSMGDQIEVAP